MMKLSEQMREYRIMDSIDNAWLKDRANEIAKIEGELDTYKHEVSVLRQLLGDDGTLVLQAIEQQEAEITELLEALEMLLNETNAGMWDCLPVDKAREAILKASR